LNVNVKLYFKYILNFSPFSFVNNLLQKSKALNLLIISQFLSYTVVHFRFSSTLFSSQLVDIFAYEVLKNNFLNVSDSFFKFNFSKKETTVVVYNLHSTYTQDRYFVFTTLMDTIGSKLSNVPFIASIAEIFPAAN
jgi:hypothetical protein